MAAIMEILDRKFEKFTRSLLGSLVNKRTGTSKNFQIFVDADLFEIIKNGSIPNLKSIA